MRRAITLLEVLISMFILTVGLLSVASLVPVGKIEQSRGDRIVRASACGRAAFREMKVRGILDPKNWARPDVAFSRLYDPTTQTYSYTNTDWAALPIIPPPDPRRDSTCPFPYLPLNNSDSHLGVVIDPLGVAAGFGSSFPYGATVATGPALPRMTSGPYGTSTSSVNARAALATSIFACSDELVFETPNTADAFPVQKMREPTGGGTAIKRMSEDHYDWLATVIPNPHAIKPDNWNTIPCRVSVVVFNRRALTIPGAGERLANIADMTGSGEVTLSVNATAAPGKVVVAPQYAGQGEGPAHLDVRAGSWLMVAGFEDKDQSHTTTDDRVWQYRWYRVVGTDATLDSSSNEVTTKSSGTGPWTKQVTIEGAGWDLSGYSPALMTEFKDQARVFLFDSIANVYEKEMMLEVDSAY